MGEINKSKLKIAYVLPSGTISGGGAVVLQHASRLIERGYNVSILVQDGAPKIEWFKNNIPILSAKRSVAKKFDILIATHWSTAQYVNSFPTKRKIYFVQSDERRFVLNEKDLLACEATYRIPFDYMTEAKWIQRWLKEEFGHNAYYVPNGLDQKIFHKTSLIEPKKNRDRIMLEGSLNTHFKGMKDAYDAVKSLNCKIWLVSSLGELNPDWKIDRFFEEVPLELMKKIYSSCDILLKMSRVEGFFGPPMEAMACGCAVVVGKCTGYDEYIVHEKNALVVETGDVEGAKNAVKRLIEDKALRNKLIKNGFKTVREWDWERSIDLLEKVIKKEHPQKFYTISFPERYDFKKEISNIRYQVELLKHTTAGLQEAQDVARSKEVLIAEKQREIDWMKSSKFWKIRNVYVRIKAFSLEVMRLSRRSVEILKEKGTSGLIRASKRYLRRIFGKSKYEIWINNNEKWDEELIKKEIASLRYKPKISVIVPVYNVDPLWLNRCIESVLNQYYDNWELCLYDDASTKKEAVSCLKKWKTSGIKRIKITFGKVNKHISGASNEALKMATGEFIALLDNDDELSPNAFYEIVKVLGENPDADMIYSDEDKIDSTGKRSDPFFKPNWSPDLFLSMMYTCHLGIYRKSIVDKIGGFRKGYEGSQDYDLVLRFIEHTRPEKILHVPKILYHWRMLETSTAKVPNSKNYAYVSASKALKDYLDRNKIKGEVKESGQVGIYRVKRFVKSHPKVSIIIASQKNLRNLKNCISSITEKTSYKNYEIILVIGQDTSNEIKTYIKDMGNHPIFKIVDYKKAANLAALNNYAVQKAESQYLLFLNENLSVKGSEWLSCMLEQAQRDEVAVVGPKILYSNGTIQNAGIIMGIRGIMGYAFKGFPTASLARALRNLSAVSGDCMMTKKEIFIKNGGFDEENLKNGYSDIDFCLRMVENGYLICYTGYSELYYNLSERYNRQERRIEDTKEGRYMKEKWEKYIKNDPFYNPNLTREKEDFSLKIDS